MSKPELFKQAKMYREGTGHWHMGWVTAAMAKVGRRVTIDGEDGTWKISEVWSETRTREQLDIERGSQRAMADVLEPHQ